MLSLTTLTQRQNAPCNTQLVEKYVISVSSDVCSFSVLCIAYNNEYIDKFKLYCATSAGKFGLLSLGITRSVSDALPFFVLSCRGRESNLGPLD